MDVLHNLVKRVARAFYGPKQVVAIEYILRNNKIRMEDLFKLLGSKTSKEFQAEVMASLFRDHLVQQETIDEAVYRPADSQHPDAKNPIRIKKVTFYYIDYQIFTNSVKYKIKKMRELLDQQAKQIDANVGFICSNCKRLYTQIEVSTLPLDPMLGIVCGVFGCGGSLAEQDNSAQRSEQEDVQSRMMKQLDPILDLIRATDSLSIPEVVRRSANADSAAKAARAARSSGNRGQSLSSPTAQNMVSNEVSVSLEDDDAAAHATKLEEAERKRKQNALPEWITRSAVEGSELPSILPKATASSRDAEKLKTEGYGSYLDALRAKQADSNEGEDDFMDAEMGIDGFEEDDEFVDVQASKRVKTDPEEDEMKGDSAFAVITDEFIDEDGLNDGDEELPSVSVRGQLVRLDEVTDEHRNQMTEEEKREFEEIRERYFGM